MKKIIIVFLINLFFITNVYGTSGTLRKNSIISCNNITYGIHSSDNHYHVAILKDDKYVASGDPIYSNPCPNESIYDKKFEVSFNECVDGDTVWLNIDKERTKFRFLAIDTPETVHPNKEVQAYGKDASSYTCNILSNAKKIEIEYDSGSSKTDKYDRHLVWIFADGNLLQEDLVKIGYAKVAYIYGSYKYTKNLCYTQSLARNEKIGLWSDSQEEGYCSTIHYKTSSSINLKNPTIKTSEKQEIPDLTFILLATIGSFLAILFGIRKKR